MTPVDPDGAYSQPNRLDIIVSDNPSKYLLWFICYDTSLTLKGKCTRAFATILIPDPRPEVDIYMDGSPDDDLDLTNTDWSSIEKMTQRSIGERLVNNDLLGFKWYWAGQDIVPFQKLINLQGAAGADTLYSLEQGTARCAMDGFSIATPDDLLQARLMGLHFCSCGWLSDGNAGFVLQYAWPDCISWFTDQIITCNWGYGNVWCKI
ncbi:hypothetical protein MAR_037423 [Mya arenaria]|uniref:Link domain-containing protein n=1 Tax=Mya arenaria TaxID=6604 RepID=A0ABY7FRH8_MYAAR|nr:hypothetical protein MAR_037423 [Mya arenaria]